jgi:TPP-dependent pyruvate/acetoin dehydrogenase alpha subunit
MVKCRMLAERIRSVWLSDNKRTRVVSGLEATLVGAGAHLQAKDCMALEHSGVLASLIKGTPLRTILERMRETQFNGAETYLPPAGDLGIATTPGMATALALAGDMKGKGAVTLMFGSQDPATSSFEPHAIAYAATQKLPIVCLVESSLESRPESNGAPAPGVFTGADPAYYPKIAVDGCDVVAVFRVAQEAIRRAREGHGPALIECMTSLASAPATGAHTRKSVQHIAQDPLTFMEQYLRKRDLWSDAWSRAIVSAFAGELDDALTLGSAHQPAERQPTDLAAKFDNVYAADDWNFSRSARPVLKHGAALS